jgi:hypothetical protein
MTGFTVPRATPVSVSGLAPTAGTGATVDLAAPVIVYGLPAVAGSPPPTPSVSPDTVRARVLNSAGAFICHLPHAQGLRCLDEHNTAGAGSIDVRRYDDVEAAHPGLWSANNQIVISVGNIDIFRLILDDQAGYRIDTATGARVDAWAGTGALGVLNSGLCAPEYGWRPEATEERTFDYGSNPAIGGWYVASEWKKPIGVKVRDSWRWTYKKRHLPKKWREKKSQWLWWKNPDTTSVADEICYFIGDPFTLAKAARVEVEVGGDDTLEFQLDGEVRATTGPGGWKKAAAVILNLSAGTHYPAAKVANTAGSTGNANRSGFICAIGKVNGDGDVVAWIRRTNPETWKIRRQLSAAPGWFAAQILRQLVSEQQARGCAGHGPVTFGFTTAVDSAGVAWAGRQELSITVGTQALDYIQQIVETGIDVAMTPGLTLNAWRSRGADRSGWVRLDQGGALALEESGSQLPAVKNTPYAKAATGWVSQTDAGSVAAHGRRETLISLGSSQSATQTAASVAAMLPDLANPPQTIEVKLSGAMGKWQPYRDFNVGDWVSYRPSGATTWVRHRVMSIAMEVNPAGHPDWTLQLYGG